MKNTIILQWNYQKKRRFISRIKETKYLSEQMAAEIMKQIFSAIIYFREDNIVHEHLATEKIIFENKKPNSNVKIIGLGFSEKLEKQSKSILNIRESPFY
ncbi:unnamed protein product [Paramecium pentaurelia]|uniref:Protein kinase domain-containing protein n=1 Tax=Paramecium pentaurelia TaxID=43138 RepID=A0A8S1UXQ7_9CILI|nr:unnamed protein product [Paramecium pentaurelia]